MDEIKLKPHTSNMGVEVIYDNVTHGMPLPEPPEEGSTEK